MQQISEHFEMGDIFKLSGMEIDHKWRYSSAEFRSLNAPSQAHITHLSAAILRCRRFGIFMISALFCPFGLVDCVPSVARKGLIGFNLTISVQLIYKLDDRRAMFEHFGCSTKLYVFKACFTTNL
jgi:hypothetical protein